MRLISIVVLVTSVTASSIDSTSLRSLAARLHVQESDFDSQGQSIKAIIEAVKMADPESISSNSDVLNEVVDFAEFDLEKDITEIDDEIINFDKRSVDEKKKIKDAAEATEAYLNLIRLVCKKLNRTPHQDLDSLASKVADLKKKSDSMTTPNKNEESKSKTLLIVSLVGGAVLLLGGGAFFRMRMKN